MLRSILIGLDGSPESGPAVALGIEWATQLKLRLAGLGIVDEPTIRRPEPMPIGGAFYRTQVVEELLKEARQKVKQALEQFEARCAEAGVECALLEESGMPYEEILRESQRYDLILLGHETHFRFGAEEQGDETLWTVLKKTPRPVVVVPTSVEAGTSVVVAYDGSPPADRALQAFQASGLDLREQVYVVGVDVDQEEATRRAERAAQFLQSHDVLALAVAREPAGGVAQTILDEVRRRSARLLVMGARGHSALREFLLGSVTSAVLGDSPVPVFLCH